MTDTPTRGGAHIAVFPNLAGVVKAKKGSGSTAHLSIDVIRLSGWLRRCSTLLITPLDIDGIGRNWKDSNINAASYRRLRHRPLAGASYCFYCIQWKPSRCRAETLNLGRQGRSAAVLTIPC